MEVWKTQGWLGLLGSLGKLGVELQRKVTHHNGQPVVVEVGAFKVFTQPLDATREKKERQDPCGRVPYVSAAPLRSSFQLPSTSPLLSLQTLVLVLTNTSNHQ